MLMEPDITYTDHGTVCMVQPLTDTAREWIEQNVSPESWQWFGGTFAVEPRCMGELLDGMTADGLVVA